MKMGLKYVAIIRVIKISMHILNGKNIKLRTPCYFIDIEFELATPLLTTRGRSFLHWPPVAYSYGGNFVRRSNLNATDFPFVNLQNVLFCKTVYMLRFLELKLGTKMICTKLLEICVAMVYTNLEI